MNNNRIQCIWLDDKGATNSVRRVFKRFKLCLCTQTGYKSYQTRRDNLRTRKLYPAPAPLAYCKHGKLLKKHMNITKAAVNIKNNETYIFRLFHNSISKAKLQFISTKSAVLAV